MRRLLTVALMLFMSLPLILSPRSLQAGNPAAEKVAAKLGLEIFNGKLHELAIQKGAQLIKTDFFGGISSLANGRTEILINSWIFAECAPRALGSTLPAIREKSDLIAIKLKDLALVEAPKNPDAALALYVLLLSNHGIHNLRIARPYIATAEQQSCLGNSPFLCGASAQPMAQMTPPEKWAPPSTTEESALAPNDGHSALSETLPTGAEAANPGAYQPRIIEIDVEGGAAQSGAVSTSADAESAARVDTHPIEKDSIGGSEHPGDVSVRAVGKDIDSLAPTQALSEADRAALDLWIKGDFNSRGVLQLIALDGEKRLVEWMALGKALPAMLSRLQERFGVDFVSSQLRISRELFDYLDRMYSNLQASLKRFEPNEEALLTKLEKRDDIDLMRIILDYSREVSSEVQMRKRSLRPEILYYAFVARSIACSNDLYAQIGDYTFRALHYLAAAAAATTPTNVDDRLAAFVFEALKEHMTNAWRRRLGQGTVVGASAIVVGGTVYYVGSELGWWRWEWLHQQGEKLQKWIKEYQPDQPTSPEQSDDTQSSDDRDTSDAFLIIR